MTRVRSPSFLSAGRASSNTPPDFPEPAPPHAPGPLQLHSQHVQATIQQSNGQLPGATEQLTGALTCGTNTPQHPSTSPWSSSQAASRQHSHTATRTVNHNTDTGSRPAVRSGSWIDGALATAPRPPSASARRAVAVSTGLGSPGAGNTCSVTHIGEQLLLHSGKSGERPCTGGGAGVVGALQQLGVEEDQDGKLPVERQQAEQDHQAVHYSDVFAGGPAGAYRGGVRPGLQQGAKQEGEQLEQQKQQEQEQGLPGVQAGRMQQHIKAVHVADRKEGAQDGERAAHGSAALVERAATVVLRQGEQGADCWLTETQTRGCMGPWVLVWMGHGLGGVCTAAVAGSQ